MRPRFVRLVLLIAFALAACGADAIAPLPSVEDVAVVADAARPAPRVVAAPVGPVGAAWLRDVAAEQPAAPEPAAEGAARERFIAERVAASAPKGSPRTALAIIAAALAGLAGMRACRWFARPDPDIVTGIVSKTGRIVVAVGQETGLFAITTKAYRVTTKKQKKSA